MFKRIWNLLGDLRISFVLLMAASATLFIGSIYAGNNFSLFGEMNRVRVQDWLAVHLGTQPELAWWIPMLFVIMGALGVNTFICASNRIARLIPQRGALSSGKFFHLLIPSLIHFLFIIIMLGHLTTFLTGKWQTIQLKTGTSVTLDEKDEPLEVQAIKDLLFPETSGLENRISQTTVTFENVDGNEINLQYLQPMLIDGQLLLLDKIKEKKKALMDILPPEDDETCNKASVYVEKMKTKQLLLIVSDPGFYIIICGLTLIMCLMIFYYLFHRDTNGVTH